MPQLNSIEEVVNYCKSNGIMLLLEYDAHSQPIGLAEVSIDTDFVHLFETIGEDPCVNNYGGHNPYNFNSEISNIKIPKKLLAELNLSFKNQDHEASKIVSNEVERTFIYFDVSDFSEHKPGEQALIINSFSSLLNIVNWTSEIHKTFLSGLEASLCIGDGYIFVFRNTHDAVGFAVALATKIGTYAAYDILPVEFHFRASVHVGPVFHFYDFGRKDWNYVGDGINGGQRILAAMGKDIDDVIYISDAVKQKLLALGNGYNCVSDFLMALTSKGRHKDKHNKLWRVHQLNHHWADSGKE